MLCYQKQKSLKFFLAFQGIFFSSEKIQFRPVSNIFPKTILKVFVYSTEYSIII